MAACWTLPGELDLNAAIDVYSHAMANRTEDLERYVAEKGFPESTEQIATHIRRIQDELFGVVTDTATKHGFGQDELEQVIERFANEKNPPLNDVGKQALLRWLHWICWHEGYLASAHNDPREFADSATDSLIPKGHHAVVNSSLLEAIEWLSNSDPATYAFVGIEAYKDGPVVQVAASNDGPLVLDVPVHALTGEYKDALAVFFNKGGLSLDPDSQSYTLYLGRDTRRCTQLIECITDEIFNVPIDRCQIMRADEKGIVRK